MLTKRLSPGVAAWLALAVILLAAGLRLWQIDRPPLWEDDYLNLDRALLPVERMAALQLRQGAADTPYDFQPPLSFALEHLALSLSPAPWAARLVSVTAGTLTIWGMFVLGRNLFGAGPGLLAALLLALSLFHLDYSRAIKAYGVYFCLSVWSSAFLTAAVRRGLVRDMVAYALAATGMLYSAYIGLPAFLGQAAWAGCAAVLALGRREPDARVKALGLCAALLVPALAYLPWLPAVFYLQGMFNAPGVNPLARFTLDFWLRLPPEYFLDWAAAPGWFLPALAGLFLAGLAWAATSGRLAALAFLAFWAGTPAASVLLSHSVMNNIVSARHLFTLLGPLTLLCACGAFAPGLLLRRGHRAALAVGLLLCLGFSWPAVRTLPEFYARSLSHDRDYFYWLATQSDRADALYFEGYKRHTKAFGARFALPGLLTPPGDQAEPAYRRLLVSQSRQRPEPLPGIHPSILLNDYAFGAFRTRTSLAGLLPASPIWIWPEPDGAFTYRADFSSLNALGDLARSQNVIPDLALSCLTPERASKPASALWRMSVPAEVDLSAARLRFSAALYKRHPDSRSDSVLTILAGPDPQRLKPVAVVSQEDFQDPSGKVRLESCMAYDEQVFYAFCARTEKTLNLTDRVGRELWIEARFSPGVVEGLVLLSSFELSAEGAWRALPAESLAARRLTAVAQSAPVRPWRPGGLLAQSGLFAFALDGADLAVTPPVGRAEERVRFLAEHPGLEPVGVLHDDNGRPAVAFYDPEPELGAARPRAWAETGPGGPAGSLALRGKLDVPSFLAGTQRVDIPVSFPRGSTLFLNPGGEGRLHWSPDFSKDAWNLTDFSYQDNIRPTPDVDYDGGLTCAGNGEQGCALVYDFVSAFPLREISLEWLPRVSAGPQGKDAVVVSLGVDEAPVKVLEHFAPKSPPGWSPSFDKHSRRLRLDPPAHHLRLKIELSGEGAQLWAHTRPVDRMWLEAKLDTRGMAPFALPAGGFPLVLAEPRANAFTVRFSPEPRPFYDSLKYWP